TMADKYSLDLFRVVIAQITQTIGYSCTLSAPLELLQDIMQKFVQEFSRDMHSQMQHANRIQPSLKDARQSLKSLSINVQELLDYIGNVEPVTLNNDVAKFPINRSSNMNFLKPESAETVSRPIYIFEYLPSMLAYESEKISTEEEKVVSQKPEIFSKKETEAGKSVEKLNDTHSPKTLQFSSNNLFDFDIGRTVREMSSVVMTMGGYISPAIEGKLPEAFVPEIIGKTLQFLRFFFAYRFVLLETLKGLDAPPVISLLIPPAEMLVKLNSSVTEAAMTPREISTQLQSPDMKNNNHDPTKSGSADISILNPHNAVVPNEKNIKISKKSKKQKPNLTDFGKYTKDTFGKIQEKAHRRALKIYQKLSKTQNESGTSQLHFKKKKRINRVEESSPEANVIKFEKLIKKQSRHRQKDLQPEIGRESGGHMESVESISSGTSASEAHVVNDTLTSENSFSIHSYSGPTVPNMHIESNGSRSVSTEEQLESPTVTSISIEPDRSKLDIFKKFSKPKSSTPDNEEFSASLLFGNTVNGPPLISLPSGTTITPTPVIGLNNEETEIKSMPINQFTMLEQTAPSHKTAVDLLIVDPAKPKKRGRKPGGKNQFRHLNTTSNALIDTVKKEKSINVMALPLDSNSMITTPSQLIATNVTTSTEPLNLSNPHATSGLLKKCQQKPKDKKERKRYKSKYYSSFLGNINIDKKNLTEKTAPRTLDKPNNIFPGQDKLLTVSSALSKVPLYSGTQTEMVQLLPLLHFPPRPGLIPSGPGLFPPTAGLVGFNNNANRVGIPPFMPLSVPDMHKPLPDVVRSSPITDITGGDQTEQLLIRPPSQTDLKLDRNYCNVAPLMPDSLKFSESKTLTQYSHILNLGGALIRVDPAQQKPKVKLLPQATGNLGDPIEVSDDSDESLQNKKLFGPRISPLSSPNQGRSNLLQPQHLQYAQSSPAVAEELNIDTNNISQAMPFVSTCESIQRFKKAVKLSLPDVKNIINTASSSSSFPSFNLPNFLGGDKFSLAGGADLIPLSRVDCGSAYSSQKVPASSLSAGATSGSSPARPSYFTICEEQQFLPTLTSFEDITITPTGTLSMDMKIRKHHKKLKRIKEGKIKKKKDKKEKSKGKDRIDIMQYKTDRKIKGLDKKQRKEKKKDKQVHLSRAQSIDNIETSCAANKYLRTLPKQSIPITSINQSVTATCQMSPKLGHSPNHVPKLTLKLSSRSTPLPPLHKDKDIQDIEIIKDPTLLPQRECERDPSPELARFSPLVTGPPKSKQCILLNEEHLLNNASSTTTLVMPLLTPIMARTTQMPINHHSNASNSIGWMSNTNDSTAASSTLSASSVLLPQQLMLMPNANINNFSSVIATSGTSQNEMLRSPNPCLENETHIADTNRPSSYVDAEGNRIWICPACGKVDDGSAMIGCDGCDAWYHWVCVGITIAPKDNDDWFCQVCITKKKNYGTEKKKKKNKKK
ncbi:hypothetical protein KR009_009397, partial [Drosophila setifemur]